MPVNVSSLIKVLAEICNEKGLRAAASESFKGGLLAGTAATLGGLILGPLGLAVGGVIGGTVAAVSAYRKFKPVAQILMEMPLDQKQLLYNKIQKAFGQLGYEDVISLTMLIMSSASLKELAIKEVVDFVVKDMNMSIQS